MNGMAFVWHLIKVVDCRTRCLSASPRFARDHARVQARSRMSAQRGDEDQLPDSQLRNSNEIAFSSAISTKRRLSEALADAADEAMFNLPFGKIPDLAVVYVSSSYEDRRVGLTRERTTNVVPQLRELVPGLRNIVGGIVDGVLGVDNNGYCTEVESRAAVSLTFACLGGARVNVFHVEASDVPDLDSPPSSWIELVGGCNPSSLPSFLLFCNAPFYSSGSLSSFVSGMDYAYPGSVKVGGVVGSPSPSPGLLYATLNKDLLTLTASSTYTDGLIGVSIEGDIEMEAIATQGVRGVGPVFTVKEIRNKTLTLLEMNRGRSTQVLPPDRALKLVVSQSSRDDQALLFKNPLLGVADDEFKDKLDDGDYLCRQLMGIDQRTGGISMADALRPGQRVRFHVRDQQAALQEMQIIMERFKRVELERTLNGSLKPVVGGFTFADHTRGVNFFREQNIQSTTFSRYLPAPMTGFFALAEVAPISQRRNPTYVHESAAIFAIVRSTKMQSDSRNESTSYDQDSSSADSEAIEGDMQD